MVALVCGLSRWPMQLYPYLHLVGAQAIFATLTGGPACRYGDLSVLTWARTT